MNFGYKIHTLQYKNQFETHLLFWIKIKDLQQIKNIRKDF